MYVYTTHCKNCRTKSRLRRFNTFHITRKLKKLNLKNCQVSIQNKVLNDFVDCTLVYTRELIKFAYTWQVVKLNFLRNGASNAILSFLIVIPFWITEFSSSWTIVFEICYICTYYTGCSNCSIKLFSVLWTNNGKTSYRYRLFEIRLKGSKKNTKYERNGNKLLVTIMQNENRLTT